MTMADNATSSFPTMGESLIGQIVNISGDRTPYTKPMAKKGFGKSGTGDPGRKANRGRSMIRNANGPACHIVTTIAYPNSGEAGKTFRNMKRVTGGNQFYSARAAASNTGNV
jgi:hypothetical protein